MSAPRSGKLSSNQNPSPSRRAITLQRHTIVWRVISIQLSAADVLQSAAVGDDLHKQISNSEKEPRDEMAITLPLLRLWKIHVWGNSNTTVASPPHVCFPSIFLQGGQCSLFADCVFLLQQNQNIYVCKQSVSLTGLVVELGQCWYLMLASALPVCPAFCSVWCAHVVPADDFRVAEVSKVLCHAVASTHPGSTWRTHLPQRG